MNKLQDVFKLSGVPTYTFVKPAEYLSLHVALDTNGRGLIVEGPSGIGKTTSVLKALDDFSSARKPLVLSARKQADRGTIELIPNKTDFGLVIIDDFHRLDSATKERYADLLKTLADEESVTCKLVLIGINKTGQPLLSTSRDLRNRIDVIKFEANAEDKIEELLTLGEKALNITLTTKQEIAQGAEGSFHIAQMLAHRACILAEFSQQGTNRTSINTSFISVKEAVLDELSQSFYGLAKVFCAGQRAKKGSRAPYLHVLNWLSKEKEWSLNIRDALSKYPMHRQSVGQIIDRGHLDGHLKANPQLDEVIFYDNTSSTISIEDPKFYYYIKHISWGNFSRNIGFPAVEFKFKYDFALSFSGSQRTLAEMIFAGLSENECSVFYDKNEEHRILAGNIEEYLGPIYSSESRYVIVLLSSDYPQRIWCKFESSQFKGRFGERAVIPVWREGNLPGFFDLTSGVGGICYDPTKEAPEESLKICETLIKKIHEERMEESSRLDAKEIDVDEHLS